MSHRARFVKPPNMIPHRWLTEVSLFFKPRCCHFLSISSTKNKTCFKYNGNAYGAASIRASSFIQRKDREYGGTRSIGDIEQSCTVLTTVSDSSSSPSPLRHLFNLLIHFKFSTYQMVICSLWTHSIVAFPLVLFNLCINTFRSKKSVLFTPSLTLYTSQHVVAGVLVIPGPVITL